MLETELLLWIVALDRGPRHPHRQGSPMTQPRSPREVFHALVHGVADRRYEDAIRLYAEQTHVEHPFDPLRAPALRTHDDLRAHFRPAATGEPKVRRRRSGFHKVAGWPGRGSVGGGSFRVMKTYTSSSSSPEASPAVATMRPEGLPAGVEGPPAGPDGAPAGRGGLAAALDWLDAAVANLATLDPAQEPDAALATGTLAAERLGDRLDAA